MAQSRTSASSKLTKKSKSRIPLWAIAAVVVLVVAVAGYAIVRFSQAGVERIKRPVAGKTTVANANGKIAFKCEAGALKSPKDNEDLCYVFAPATGSGGKETKAYAWWYQNKANEIAGPDGKAKVCVNFKTQKEKQGKSNKGQLEIRGKYLVENSGDNLTIKYDELLDVKKFEYSAETANEHSVCSNDIAFSRQGGNRAQWWEEINAQLDPAAGYAGMWVTEFYIKDGN